MMFGITALILSCAAGIIAGFILGVKDVEEKSIESFEEGLSQGIEVHRNYVAGLLAEARKEMENNNAP